MPNTDVTLTDKEARLISFAVSCYLEDFGKAIKREERSGKTMMLAKNKHAEIQRLQLTKLTPSALCGELTLLDNSIIKP